VSTSGWIQIGVYFAVLFTFVKPLGGTWRASSRREDGPRTDLRRLQALLLRLCDRPRSDAGPEEMSWRTYAFAMLAFNVVGIWRSSSSDCRGSSR
jgi:K+-transporting ATPase ATPase A chain